LGEFGTKSDFYYTDLEETLGSMNSDGRERIEKYLTDTEKLLLENGMSAKMCVEVQYKYKISFNGKDYSISCQQGIHTKADEYEYLEGVVPQSRNEIAITPTISRMTGAKLGDTVTIDFGEETLDCIVVAYFQTMNALGQEIRLHEDAPTDFKYVSNILSYQINFDDNPSAKEKEIRRDKLKELLDNEKIWNSVEYCDNCMGAASAIESVQYLLLGITLVVVILVCILMERSFIADDRSQIAILKAIGFDNNRIIKWHIIRFGIATLVSVLLAAICSIPAIESKKLKESRQEKLARGEQLMRKLGIIEIADNDMNELVKLNNEGTTIVMVTHDAKVAARCGRVLFIVDGNIRGEYTSLSNISDEKERERGLNNWLLDLGW